MCPPSPVTVEEGAESQVYRCRGVLPGGIGSRQSTARECQLWRKWIDPVMLCRQGSSLDAGSRWAWARQITCAGAVTRPAKRSHAATEQRSRRPAIAEQIAVLTRRDRTLDYLNDPRTFDDRARSLGSRMGARHPLAATALGALVAVWVTIGLVYRVAAAQHTVTSGWAVALAAGLVIGGAPVVVIGRFWRQPYSRATIRACLGILALVLAGLSITEPLCFEGWLPTSYVITSPLQVAALAWLIPVFSSIAALFVGVLLFYPVARHIGLRRTRGSTPAPRRPGQGPDQGRGRA